MFILFLHSMLCRCQDSINIWEHFVVRNRPAMEIQRQLEYLEAPSTTTRVQHCEGKKEYIWVGSELDYSAILRALASLMATNRPEITPQETQVSQGWGFSRVMAALSHWLETARGRCGSNGHHSPPCAHRSTSLPRFTEQHIMVPRGLSSRGCEWDEIQLPMLELILGHN